MLTYAANNNHPETVAQLLLLGADTEVQDNIGRTAKQMASDDVTEVLEGRSRCQ